MTRWTMTLAMAGGAMMMACGETGLDPLEPGANPGGDDVVDAPDDPTDPGTEPNQVRSLSQADKDAIGAILEGVDGLGGWTDGMGAVDEVGTLTLDFGLARPAPTTTGTTGTSGKVGVTVMDGFAFQASDTFGGDTFEFTAVIAWDGLDAKAQTVDEMLIILAPDIVDPGSVDVVSLFVDDPSQKPEFGAMAFYSDYPAGKAYIGTGGTFTIDAVTFDTEVPCTDAPKWFTTCTVSEGQLEGELDIEALGFDGSVIVIGGGVPGPSGKGSGNGQLDEVELTAEFDLPVSRITTEQ